MKRNIVSILAAFIFMYMASYATGIGVEYQSDNKEFAKGNTINTRFEIPDGYRRVEYPEGSFANWIQNLPLKPSGYETHLYNGALKPKKVAVAVVDMDVEPYDLQQCADALMRLRAEYLFQQGRFKEISFHLANGFECDFDKWAKGYRVKVTGNTTSWYKKNNNEDYSYKNLRDYLLFVYKFANTTSLYYESETTSDVEVGNFYISPAKSGRYGHVVIIVDKIVNENDPDDFAILLAQSYMPAQEIEVLMPKAKYKEDIIGKYWTRPHADFYNSTEGEILTPEWKFSNNDFYNSKLKKFK